MRTTTSSPGLKPEGKWSRALPASWMLSAGIKYCLFIFNLLDVPSGDPHARWLGIARR
jgi:hypothetical protein